MYSTQTQYKIQLHWRHFVLQLRQKKQFVSWVHFSTFSNMQTYSIIGIYALMHSCISLSGGALNSTHFIIIIITYFTLSQNKLHIQCSGEFHDQCRFWKKVREMQLRTYVSAATARSSALPSSDSVTCSLRRVCISNKQHHSSLVQGLARDATSTTEQFHDFSRHFSCIKISETNKPLHTLTVCDLDSNRPLQVGKLSQKQLQEINFPWQDKSHDFSQTFSFLHDFTLSISEFPDLSRFPDFQEKVVTLVALVTSISKLSRKAKFIDYCIPHTLIHTTT